MSTWKTASLGEIFEISRGGSPRPIQDYLTDDPNGVNWISISDASASSKFITTTKKRIRPEGVSRSRMVKPGDFLLTNSMSFGRPYIMGTNGCIHDGWLVLSSKHDEVDQDYFFQLLSSDFIYAKFSKLAAGATVKNLNIDLVSGVEVTFPPLEEQRRIAAILDQAETLRTQRRTALALLDSLTKSLFLDMFGDPVANPKGWPIKPVSSLGKVVTGNTPSRDVPAYYGNSVEWIKSDNLNTPHYYVTKASEGLSEAGKAVGRLVPPKSILVTCIAGSPDCIGNAAMADREVAFNQQINAFIPVELDAHFAYAQIVVGKKLIQGASTNGMKGMVSKSRFEAIRLIAPLPLQQTFATRIAAIEALKTTHRRALAALDALFASLQQRAFTGAL